ncbi:MAG TPA: hypothetical protein VF533_07190 [Solirubrobacteraceae bacterium]|jgi:hypothetical protein
MPADPVLEALSRLTEALITQTAAFGGLRESIDAQRDVLLEVARNQHHAAERRVEALPPLDPAAPGSRDRRLFAMALSLRAYAAGLGADFLSAQFEDGTTLSWDTPTMRIVHPEVGSLTLQELAARVQERG